MRQLPGSTKHTKVVVLDEPSHGNACHKYAILRADDESAASPLEVVTFQQGPIKEHGVNGILQEDLIAIVIDRLEGFNSGDYRCRENSLAITKLEEALHWLRHRTAAREARGVEGTSEV